MQRVIAETVQTVQLTLVYGVVPVHTEYLIDDGGHLVYIVAVERHYAYAQDVGHVVQRVVFAAFQFQFASER